MASLWSPYLILALSVLLRIFLLFYGLYQDANSPLKYTDIDYSVFTSASAYVARGLSPYLRETYRYTPLLAWILLPTTWGGAWFSFGKLVFALSDIVAGWLIVLVLQDAKGGAMTADKAIKFASIWLLNPMVATISTRGSSEGLLGVMVIGVLWAVVKGRVILAGILLGLSVHFKIYPFIYGVSILWWLDDETNNDESSSTLEKVLAFPNQRRIVFVMSSLITFASLNVVMFYIYGFDFLQHTYLHHVTRIDHRHNFSPYNTLLYLASSPASTSTWHLESLAFLPQLFLSAFAIPLTLAKNDLASTMMAQTFAFVCFNKVCTSQYFLWYMIFLPFYLPGSSLLEKPVLGAMIGGLWIASQGIWLQQAFGLEFLGQSNFVPGLWLSSLFFFSVNIALLGIFIEDIAQRRRASPTRAKRL